MLAGKYGFKTGYYYDRVEKEGKMYQSDSFGIGYYDRKDGKTPQFGFIVSNKISPDSTLRNRIKRALKEAIRYMVSEVKPSYDIVFLAKQRALRKSTDEIMKEVKAAMKGAGLCQ